MRHMHDNPQKDMRFDKRAAAYDKGFEGRISQRFYRLLLNELTLVEGARVLDVGCGTGALLSMMNSKCRIVGAGIDMEQNMIDQARQNCPDMDIRVSRCEATPFEDEAFDVLTCCMAYHHFSDKPGFAREALRILKPGGLLYIADPRFPLPIRAPLNGILSHAGIVGEFCVPEEIYSRFEVFGFEPAGKAKDAYAQVIRLKKVN